MAIIGALEKPYGRGAKYKIYEAEVSGPSSYDPTTGYEVDTGLRGIQRAVVVLRNNPGNKLITYSVSGSSVVIHIYTIAADTTTGAISATEDASGTDESSLTFNIIAIGY